MRFPALRRLAGLACLAIAANAAAALAQGSDPAAAQEITVEAPRSIPGRTEIAPHTGAPVVTTYVRIAVLYGDLDLATERDADRLLTRLANVANSACYELDRLHPFTPDADCAAKAAASSKDAARRAIAAARARGN